MRVLTIIPLAPGMSSHVPEEMPVGRAVRYAVQSEGVTWSRNAAVSSAPRPAWPATAPAAANTNPLTGDDRAATIAPSPGRRTILMLTPFQARTGGFCVFDGAPHWPRGPALPWWRCDRSQLGLPDEAVSGVPAISQLPPPCRYLLRPGCPGECAPPGTPGTSPPGRHTRSPPRRAAGPGTGRARSQPPG